MSLISIRYSDLQEEYFSLQGQCIIVITWRCMIIVPLHAHLGLFKRPEFKCESRYDHITLSALSFMDLC